MGPNILNDWLCKIILHLFKITDALINQLENNKSMCMRFLIRLNFMKTFSNKFIYYTCFLESI